MMIETFTSPVIEDEEKNGRYLYDCWNIDYCKVHRKKSMKMSCLIHEFFVNPRCTTEKKIKIREDAIQKGFVFE